MANDVSNQTVAVLLVLAIVVSLIGSWIVISSVQDATIDAASVREGTAKATIRILGGETNLEQEKSTEGGKVAIKVINPNPLDNN